MYETNNRRRIYWFGSNFKPQRINFIRECYHSKQKHYIHIDDKQSLKNLDRLFMDPDISYIKKRLIKHSCCMAFPNQCDGNHQPCYNGDVCKLFIPKNVLNQQLYKTSRDYSCYTDCMNFSFETELYEITWIQ